MKSGGATPPLSRGGPFEHDSRSSLLVVVFFGAIAGFSLVVGLFLQLGLRYTPLEASLAMSAWAVGAFVGSVFGGVMMDKLGRAIVHFVLALMAAGLVGMYVMFAGAGLGGWDLAAPLVLYGTGMGMIFVALFDIIVGDFEDHEVGSASGLLSSFQQLGASLGVAVLGTVFFGAIGAHADARNFLDAAGQVTLLTIGLTVLTFFVGFLLPKKARPHEEPAESALPGEVEPAST